MCKKKKKRIESEEERERKRDWALKDTGWSSWYTESGEAAEL